MGRFRFLGAQTKWRLETPNFSFHSLAKRYPYDVCAIAVFLDELKLAVLFMGLVQGAAMWTSSSHKREWQFLVTFAVGD